MFWFYVFVLVVTQIVFIILGVGGVVDWSIWVLASPVLFAIGAFCFLFFCSMVNVMTPTKQPISSDTVGINDETSAMWIAKMIEEGNITLDQVEPGDREEVLDQLPDHLKPKAPQRQGWSRG
jgi:hypothetical protein